MNRIAGFSLFTISPKAVRKKERSELLKMLDLIIQQKLSNATPINDTAINEEADFMEKYDPFQQIDQSINRSYFIKSYGYGLILFAFPFILFLLTGKNNNHLFYIIVSFILYPFAKVLIDRLFGFKLRYILKKQKGPTHNLEQLMIIFDLVIFHLSLFIAPIGILFLLLRCYSDKRVG